MSDRRTPPTRPGLDTDLTFGKAYDARLVRRLWAFFGPHRGLLVLSALTYPAVAALQLLQPFLVKVAIDDHIVPKRSEGLGLVVAALAGVVVVEFGGRFAQTVLTQLLGQRVTHDLRQALFERLQTVDLAYIERNPVGRLMTRVTNDVESLSETFSTGAISIVGDIVTLLGIVVMMTALDWRLSLYSFSVLPPLIVFVLIMRTRAREAFRRVRSVLAQMNAFLSEAISGMSVIQVFRQERAVLEEFQAVNGEHRDANFAAIRYDAITYAVVEAISTIAVALLILLGYQLFDANAVEVGVFVAFVEYLRRFFQPITELSTKYTVLQSAMAGAERCVDLLDQRGTIIEADPPQSLQPFGAELSFEHVSFRYDERGRDVLFDLNLTVRRQEKVAIVGPTGGGKSTLVKLLARFYDPSAGRIAIDGVDIRQARLDDVRAKLAIVLQEPHLIDASIRDNISFGLSSPAMDRLAEAARRTCADAVIARATDGWDTKVGERGSKLSSGERQLIAFARALALNPEILILDEATSSVDPETEALIQRGLEALVENRTAIIIAHRLSTIRRADRILVLSGGRIVEEGTHDELLAADGVYRKLYELQFTDEDSRDLPKATDPTTASTTRDKERG